MAAQQQFRSSKLSRDKTAIAAARAMDRQAHREARHTG
jgi:hypothetical protein